MANFIKNEGIEAKCLKDYYYDEKKNRICLTVAVVIYKFKLLNNLKRVLGFSQDSFTCINKKTFCAENEPQLIYELSNMYVYASILEPIRVGHALVPLLKNVYIDTTKNFEPNQLRNVPLKHLMYIPLNVSIINSIEINI